MSRPTKDSKDTLATSNKAGKRKLDTRGDSSSGCHGNTDDNSVNKKEIQDGFSWWTSMMVGVDPRASHVVVNKICERKVPHKRDGDEGKHH